MPSNAHSEPAYATNSQNVGAPSTEQDPHPWPHPWVNPYFAIGDTPDTAVTIDVDSGGRSDTLQLRFNIGDGIPLNVIAITGIQFEVEAEAPINRAWSSVKAIQGFPTGVEKGSLYLIISDTKQFTTFGGPGDLWGLTWTRQQVASLSLGLALQAYRGYDENNGLVSVYRVRATVYYIVPTPVVAVTPAALSFKMAKGQTNPMGKQLLITNTGETDSTLTWNQSADSPWLTATPDSGNAPGKATVAVNARDLDPGVYNGMVTFTPKNVDAGVAKQVPVEFIITDSEDSFQAVI